MNHLLTGVNRFDQSLTYNLLWIGKILSYGFLQVFYPLSPHFLRKKGLYPVRMSLKSVFNSCVLR